MTDLPTFVAWLLFMLLLASTSIPFFVIGEILDRCERRRPRIHHSRADRQPPPDHRLTKRERHPSASRLKTMLLTLYEPQYDFLVGVTDLRPATRMGYYNPSPYYRITVHSGWHCDTEVAVHEFAHHLVCTELPRHGHRRPRLHGREFKTVYSILIDTYNSKYSFIQPDRRYYLPPQKRVRGISFDVKK